MVQQLILHIPHAFTHIPDTEGYVLPLYRIRQEMNKLTDHYTDQLFYSERDRIICAEFSRIFCDVERFADDTKESMSKKGMGVFYTHCDDGQILRNVDPENREKWIRKYYHSHHRRLQTAVAEQLYDEDCAAIVDCHSFSERPFLRDEDQKIPRPDICIGTDNYHTPNKWVSAVKDHFEKMGLTVAVNIPYAGTMVPEKYYGKDSRVMSIMIEVNRKLYMHEDTLERNDTFSYIRTGIMDLLNIIRESI